MAVATVLGTRVLGLQVQLWLAGNLWARCCSQSMGSGGRLWAFETGRGSSWSNLPLDSEGVGFHQRTRGNDMLYYILRFYIILHTISFRVWFSNLFYFLWGSGFHDVPCASMVVPCVPGRFQGQAEGNVSRFQCPELSLSLPSLITCGWGDVSHVPFLKGRHCSTSQPVWCPSDDWNLIPILEDRWPTSYFWFLT